MNTRLRFLILVLLAAGHLSMRGAGVTVVTHGFLGNVTDWVIPMLDNVPAYSRFPGTNFSCYSITIRENSQGNIVFSRALLGGNPPTTTDSGEILVKLDWSDLAGFFGASSTDVAVAAANSILSTNLFPELGARALAELPLHLVGHSRGGSVVSEITRLLGAQGVWVDHLTLLDPHPVSEFGDAAVRMWHNVLFAESFWQMNGDPTCPNGASYVGAYNRFLSNLSGGYSCPHSDVHLWYHGTIDLNTPTGDSDATITATERQNWWTVAEAAGAEAGFRYSRMGGGDRLSSAQPAGQGTSRIRDGMNQRWDFGAGLSGNRTSLPANSGLWPNVIQFAITGTNELGPGASTTARLVYQSGAAVVRAFLDRDSNPFNSNSLEVLTVALPGTGISNVSFIELSIAPTNAPPGQYAVYVQLVSGSRARYLYAPQHLTISGSLEPPQFSAVARSVSGSTDLTIEAPVGQRLVIQASADLTNWVSLSTNTVVSTPVTFSDSSAATQRFYRAFVLP